MLFHLIERAILQCQKTLLRWGPAVLGWTLDRLWEVHDRQGARPQQPFTRTLLPLLTRLSHWAFRVAVRGWTLLIRVLVWLGGRVDWQTGGWYFRPWGRRGEEWIGDLREYRETRLASGQSPWVVELETLWQIGQLFLALIVITLSGTRERTQQEVMLRLTLGASLAVTKSYGEAISQLTKGLELLRTLPDTPERSRQELTLQLTLGTPLAVLKGYTAPEVELAYGRARELCHQVEDTPQISRVLGGLWRLHNMRAELRIARQLGADLLRRAQRTDDPGLRLAAHLALGATSSYLGEFASARAHLEHGIVLYDAQQHRAWAFLYHTAHSVVGCLSIAAWVVQLLGYPTQALHHIHEALTLAQQLAHPFSLAYALCHAAVVHQLCREGRAAQAYAEAAITLATKHADAQGFGMWWAMGTMLRGWALAEQGQGEAGIAHMRQGLAAWRASGAELAVPYWSAMLVEGYGKSGQADEGLRVVDEVLAGVDTNGQRFFEAELHRLKGELLVLQATGRGSVGTTPTGSARVGEVEHAVLSEAATCFRRARAVACDQQARWLELRAVQNVSRLLQQQDKRDEARQLLGETYRWFPEGLDLRDLQEARALLAELS